MKKQTLVSAAAAAAMVPLFGVSGFASAAGITSITLNPEVAGRDACSIYDSAGSSTLLKCNVTGWDNHGDDAPRLGFNYDAMTKTLTLDSAVNNVIANLYEHANIEIQGDDSITVISNGNIHGLGFTVNDSDLTFNFGIYSYVGPTRSGYAIFGNTLTVKSGTVSLSTVFNTGSVKHMIIDGGTVEIGDYNDPRATTFPRSITLNNGTLKFINTETKVSGDITINGGYFDGQSTYANKINGTAGKISINGGSTIAKLLSAENELVVTGGTISASGGEKGLSGSNVKISGGNITLDGFSFAGIESAGKVSFSGGTTTIKNSEKAVVAKEIAFGNGIGIKEDGVQVENEDNTSYIDANLVTIAKVESDPEGGDPESKPGDTEGGDDQPVPEAGGEAPKTPDTGAFSASSSAVLIALSVVLVAILSGAGYLGVYSVNRHNRKVKFNK